MIYPLACTTLRVKGETWVATVGLGVQLALVLSTDTKNHLDLS